MYNNENKILTYHLFATNKNKILHITISDSKIESTQHADCDKLSQILPWGIMGIPFYKTLKRYVLSEKITNFLGVLWRTFLAITPL